MSVTTILKSRWTGTLVMGLVALSVAILAALLLLPGRAEAQAEAQEEEQAAANTTRTVGPGESLWTIAHARLAPEATPQQVAEEVERIYAFNRERIGDDPNLLLVGQELLVSPAVRPAAASEEAASVAPIEEAQRVAPDNTASVASAGQPAEEGPAEANDGPASSAEEPVSAAAEEEEEEVAAEEAGSSSSEPEYVAGGGVVGSVIEGIAEKRKVLGLGVLLLTVLIAALMAWKLPLTRPTRGSSRGYGENYSGYYDNYALPSPPEQEQEEQEKEGEEQAHEAEVSEVEAPPEQAEVEPTTAETSAVPAGSTGAYSRQHRLRRIHVKRTPGGR